MSAYVGSSKNLQDLKDFARAFSPSQVSLSPKAAYGEPLKIQERLLVCSGTSLVRNIPFLGPYSRTISRVLRWSQGGWVFLISEVLLYIPPAASIRQVGLKK